MDRSVRVVQHTSLGMFWVIGWLFSIGFLKLTFAHGLIALVLWPYYLGAHFAEATPQATYWMEQSPVPRG